MSFNTNNNNVINVDECLSMDLNINNEILAQKSSLENMVNIGQGPTFENNSNSNFFGQKNNDYKLIGQL